MEGLTMLEPMQQLKLLVQERPWEGEPNEAEWDDDFTWYKCRIRRNPQLLHLCGYVSVPKSHPAYGKPYDEPDLKVHGGLTYSDDHADGFWYFGFDCGHAGDLVPGVLLSLINIDRRGGYGSNDVYRTWEYVDNEVQHLVSELWRIEKWGVL